VPGIGLYVGCEPSSKLAAAVPWPSVTPLPDTANKRSEYVTAMVSPKRVNLRFALVLDMVRDEQWMGKDFYMTRLKLICMGIGLDW